MILQSHPSDAQAWSITSAPGCVLALPAPDAARFGEVASRLAGPDGFRAALELLLEGGIASAPSFALLDGDTAVARVVLRGDVSVVVTARDRDVDDLTISGAGVATWSERVLEGADTLRLDLPGGVSWTVTLDSADGPLPAAQVPTTPVAVADDVAVAEATLVPPVPPVPPVAEPAFTPDPVMAPVAVPAPAEPYDFLFGDTIYRTQAGVAVRIPNPDPERPGDHDGTTMLAADLGLSARVVEPTGDASAEDQTIVAPISGYVSALSMPLVAPITGIPSYHLERADGAREPLGRPVVIGRAPTAPSGTASGSEPRLITIADDKDISRSHLRVAVEGDAVVVTDLASKNGTVVTLPGASARKLRAHEPAVVLPGTLIDLGGGVSFTVREG